MLSKLNVRVTPNQSDTLSREQNATAEFRSKYAKGGSVTNQPFGKSA